ncbi:PD-(D/E)XK nuclease-like domain-containing protein [Synechococcus sp. WH 8101]|uniref:PD-(D/E)XK nuclease-like domain-containing protein n=1 Tax=Synechococcus sp. WH 8101 TaxID=59932 RepID=UPI001022E2B1|nr:PD-(D/E)XK nuclease-like domain-containing protein [Synechococcus sp. WH 8101]
MPSPQATAAPGTSALITYQQSDADYRNAPGLSQSEARELLRSAAHWQARYGPDAEPLQPTRAMLFGQAFHCRILEPADFCSRYADRQDLEVNLNLSELKALATARGLQVSSGARLNWRPAFGRRVAQWIPASASIVRSWCALRPWPPACWAIPSPAPGSTPSSPSTGATTSW